MACGYIVGNLLLPNSLIQMKKFFMFVVLVIVMAACSQEYNDTELSGDANVPVAMQDSTEWRTVQLYETKNGETIYIKESDKEVHKLEVVHIGQTMLLIAILIVALFISILIIADLS
jgi:hypothetical protein